MSGIRLTEVDDATIATPPAGKSTLILDDVLGWAHKDDDGVTRSLQGEDGEITYSNIGNTGSSEAVDWAGPDVQRLVANAATVTLTYTNVPASGTYGVKRLWLAQDGTGGRIWDFPASTDWGLAGEPDWSTRPASHVDIVDLQTVDGGTVVIASIAGREGPAGSSDLDAIITASSGQDIADALAGAAAPDAANVFATMADVGVGGGSTITACRAYHNAAQTIATSTATALALNSERFDDATFHDTSTNNSRLTFAAAKKGEVTAVIQWTANATGYRQVGIRLNGSSFLGLEADAAVPGGSQETRQVVSSGVFSFAMNDYVEVVVAQNSGGNLDISSFNYGSPEVSVKAW